MAKKHLVLLISLIILSTSHHFIGAAIGIALPEIRSEYQISISRLAWVNTGYFLPYVALMPIIGRIADMYGRKKTLIVGFIVFLVGTTICGTSPMYLGLVFGRLLQGIGTAGINPISMAAIQSFTPSAYLGTQLGIWQGAGTLIRFLGSSGAGIIIEL